MSGPVSRARHNWVANLAWAVLILLVGAGLTVWGLSRWEAGARFLGVAPETAPLALHSAPGPIQPPKPARTTDDDAANEARIAALEARLRSVESAAERAAGSVGRADALLVAFASRRAIDRGVPLGYLETLLAERFAARHPRAVATIITASRNPVTLERLTGDYARLEGELRRGPPAEGLWQGIRRELGSIVAVRRASAPSPKPEARFERALARLEQGEVDGALAETMRLPGAARAGPWVAEARRYVAAHRALDEIESAALLSGTR